ncbi:hypothetical protein COCVIDRAFT_101126 [Bipolaris victoriae FI3]|uniref:Uncharacterized protein n=1 Tax=Bipolaris victoriae (strain FI3) TaxID=930091 RepID=W7EHP4_BIPV3|nr:hypothetical protein COCVIDRAFT_101126 [Bipolaris victoriae FI3]
MHFSTVALPLFLAATTTAAPLVRASSLDNGFPITVWGGSTCSGKATTVLYMPTDGKCYPTSPVFSGNTDSFRVTADNIATLPAGCSVIVFDDDNCKGDSTTIATVGGACNTFGPNKPIRSARTVGCK